MEVALAALENQEAVVFHSRTIGQSERCGLELTAI